MENTTVIDYLEKWSREQQSRVWLRETVAGVDRQWTWSAAKAEIDAIAAWLAQRFAGGGANIAILSRNRAHWVLADLAITASGNCSVPIFTNQKRDVVDYLIDFTDTQALFLGESENWDSVRACVPEHVDIITFPDVEDDRANYRWDTLRNKHTGQAPAYQCKAEDIFTLIFTSGTTGMPKGVMQNHTSMIEPMLRARACTGVRKNPRLLSYLPLSHVAERQLVLVQSLISGGEITFAESMATLLRDLSQAKPHFFFGAPRVWEQMCQYLFDHFGGQGSLDARLLEDLGTTQQQAQALLGLQEADYLISASAPISAALIEWFDSLGITIVEGYGMSEACAILTMAKTERRLGSIGKAAPGVELRLSEEGELLCRAAGMSPGYYKMPDKTAETFVDGWLHTGDKMRVDEDGYYYITGRVKDYFKTIHGKYVAPVPIEDEFSSNPHIQQQCLLGRGYSKTVMVVVRAPQAAGVGFEELELSLKQTVNAVNSNVEKHARIGGVIVSDEPWSIENNLMTVTLKMKRDFIEARFGAVAERLAKESAVRGKVMIESVKL